MDEEVKRLVEAHDVELWTLRNKLANEANSLTSKDEFLKHRLSALEQTIALLKEHERVVRFQLGLPYEKVAHPLEAVLTGFGGLSQ